MTKRTPYVPAPRATLAMGAAGALVGGAVAAARNYGKVQSKEMTREEAVKNVIRETGTTGLATATATALVGVLALPSLLSLVGMVAVAAGTKHMTDKVLDARRAPKKAPAKAAAPTKPAPKKAAKKKTAKPKTDKEQ